MTDCEGDAVAAKSPMELYEKLNAQGETVRALKTAKAVKVSCCKLSCKIVFLPHGCVSKSQDC